MVIRYRHADGLRCERAPWMIGDQRETLPHDRRVGGREGEEDQTIDDTRGNGIRRDGEEGVGDRFEPGNQSAMHNREKLQMEGVS